MDKHIMFRIATLLYAESEGIKKKNTVLKRVIEAAFVEKDNIPMTVDEIENCINELFEITILQSEIEAIINDEDKHFERVADKQKIKVCLSRNRFKYLLSNLQKGIVEFIDEFLLANNLEQSVKDIILSFLYDVCQRNVCDFTALIEGKNNQVEEVTGSLYLENAEYINAFLQWDNPEKNQALIALQGYSLEYSMLTCNADVLYGSRLGTMFSNKHLYIDTNIIYYCLGVNGDEFKNANEALLDKCIACGEKLLITRYTEEEFNNTLDHYIDEITKYDSVSVSRLNYHKYMHNHDIYLFYLEWKNKRKKFSTPSYFKSFLQGEYVHWKQKYKISIEDKAPYDEKDERNSELISCYCEAFPYKGKINYDAYNIFWVEQKRLAKRVCHDFSSTEDFILSPHKLIKRWDSTRKNAVPVIITPTMWMTLLNRFISRGKDDYECFKNYISIKVLEDNPINNREFLCIVKAIEEVTEDLNQQENIIDEFVTQKFSYLDKETNEDISLDEVQEKTKEASQKYMDFRVSELEKQVSELNAEITKNNKIQEYQIEKHRDIVNEKNNVLEKNAKYVEETNKRLAKAEKDNQKLINHQLNRSLRWKQSKHGVVIIFSIILVLWQIIDLFVMKNPNNLFCSFIINMISRTVFENNLADVALYFFQFIISIIVYKMDYSLSKIFWDEKVKEDYLIKQRKKIELKLK